MHRQLKERLHADRGEAFVRLRGAVDTSYHRTHQAAGLVVHEKVYEPCHTLPVHRHSHAALVLVLSGTFVETCCDRTVARTAGTRRVMPAEEPHGNSYGTDRPSCLLVEIHGARLHELAALAPSLHRVGHFPTTTRPAVLAHCIHEELVTADDLTPLAIDGLLSELLAAASRPIAYPVDAKPLTRAFHDLVGRTPARFRIARTP